MSGLTDRPEYVYEETQYAACNWKREPRVTLGLRQTIRVELTRHARQFI
jgi:hypothetical protein